MEAVRIDEPKLVYPDILAEIPGVRLETDYTPVSEPQKQTDDDDVNCAAKAAMARQAAGRDDAASTRQKAGGVRKEKRAVEKVIVETVEEYDSEDESDNDSEYDYVPELRTQEDSDSEDESEDKPDYDDPPELNMGGTATVATMKTMTMKL